MKIIEIQKDNLAYEHICCAISDAPGARACIEAKKGWMNKAFEDGYHFWRLDARGKAFIECIPAENAWCPIEAEGWLFIDCFWVSGQFKGKGVANVLFEKALAEAIRNNRKGLVALSSEKKRPFLSDPGYYLHKGFIVADTAPPYYSLLALPMQKDVSLPKFGNSVKNPVVESAGVTVYYSDHCPHTSKYVALLDNVAKNNNIQFYINKIASTNAAQIAPNPFTTYAMFYNGKFVTNEIFSEGKFRKFLNLD